MRRAGTCFRVLNSVSTKIGDVLPEWVSASVNIFDFQHGFLIDSSQLPLVFRRLETMVPLLVLVCRLRCFSSRKEGGWRWISTCNCDVYQSA